MKRTLWLALYAVFGMIAAKTAEADPTVVADWTFETNLPSSFTGTAGFTGTTPGLVFRSLRKSGPAWRPAFTPRPRRFGRGRRETARSSRSTPTVGRWATTINFKFPRWAPRMWRFPGIRPAATRDRAIFCCNTAPMAPISPLRFPYTVLTQHLDGGHEFADFQFYLRSEQHHGHQQSAGCLFPAAEQFDHQCQRRHDWNGGTDRVDNFTVTIGNIAQTSFTYWDTNGSAAGLGGTGVWDSGNTKNWNDSTGTGTPVVICLGFDGSLRRHGRHGDHFEFQPGSRDGRRRLAVRYHWLHNHRRNAEFGHDTESQSQQCR